MTQTDKEFIAWIAALAKKAAPGPWTRNPLDSPCEYNSIFAPTTSDGSRHLVTTPVIGHFGGANSDFIAAARTAIPRLIAMVEDREREREDARIASGIERKASDPAKEIWWDVALEIAADIRANADRLRAE